MEETKVIMFHPIDGGARARFSLDGVMGSIFRNESEGAGVVAQYLKDKVVSPTQAEGMERAASAHSYSTSPHLPPDKQAKCFMIRPDGTWLPPPDEGKSFDLSPPPAKDEAYWKLHRALLGSLHVH